MNFYEQPAQKIPSQECDVVVVGGGTGGVIAAIAAARGGARTTLIESKGYVGGTAVEGGTALHSYFNLFKPFGVEKRQLVKGIPQEIIDRLMAVGGTSGHAEMLDGFDYDCFCTAIDTELYKLVAAQMLEETGVSVLFNTQLVDAICTDGHIRGVLAESRSGREAIMARSFVDATGYGDLCARAGAAFTEPNDHAVANSMGVGNVDVEKFCAYLQERKGLGQLSRGLRSGKANQIVRFGGAGETLPEEFRAEGAKIGLACITTTVHDNYLMFLKLNIKLEQSCIGRDVVSKAETELRRRQLRAIELLREHIPGCERAFIARTSPTLTIRRGRCIACDYDISLDEILNGAHFDDDVLTYGFHDCAPRLQVKNGASYGLPYRAMLVKNIENLYATGMMITSSWEAHMSTRNTVSCMAQGQAAGTAAALCAQKDLASRKLQYGDLRKALVAGGVVLEN
jgi:glycine/D-amino acid oxidase-like deaminating enzyme